MNSDINISQEAFDIFNAADKIFHPSNFTFDVYSKYFNANNFMKLNHNDIVPNKEQCFVPKIINDTINIGCMHVLTECKGKIFIEMLMKSIHMYHGYVVKWFFPSYDENAFFDCLVNNNINCVVHLNKYGETWCYALTKSLCSGVPIIYNNFGSFKERIQNKEWYFKVYDDEKDMHNDIDYTLLFLQFKKFLDYVILHNGTGERIMPLYEYSAPYDAIFKPVI
jgi:hypothetical protein